MKRGPFIAGVSARGITLRDNKRNDEAGYTAKNQVVNYAQVNGSVVRGIPETDDFSLYWFQGEEGGPDGTTHRYWISKADGVELTGAWSIRRKGTRVSTMLRPVTCPSICPFPRLIFRVPTCTSVIWCARSRPTMER